MRTWLIKDIEELLNFRDKEDKPNYTTVVGLLFEEEKKYLELINIHIQQITTGYSLIIFKDNLRS